MRLPSTFVELCRTILIFAYCFYNIHMLQCHHKLTMLFSTKAKNPRTAFRGFFYSVLLWRLNPQAGHRLFITIQPFDDVTAGSIFLPSFTTPVFLLRLRRLSSTFSVNSHLTVLRHTPKAESMLAGSTENQASVHFRKWENPETQPRFPDGVPSYKKTTTNTHKKGRSGYSPFLPFLISFIFFLFFYFLIFYLQNFDSFSFSSRYLHSLACTNSGTSSIFSGLSFPSIICTYS